MEGERRLYHDVAGRLAGPLGRSTATAERTRVVDSEVARALGRGVDQVVLVGAGYDGRALRFGSAAVRWFEVDLPTTLADKRYRLDALGLSPPSVTAVGIDLRRADLGAALDAAGHDPGAPSLFVCEALLSGLTLEETASLCDTLRARAPAGSALVADFWVSPEPGAAARVLRSATDASRAVIGEPRRTELRPGDPDKLMVVTGWHVVHATPAAASRIDRGSHTVVLVCEPDPARRA